MKIPSPPRAVVTERRTLDAKQWQACAIDPRAFGGMYDGGYRETCVENGVAFVYVCGPLDHHQGWWLDSYDSIVARVEYALADVDASAVVMCFDSPGGDASGVEEAHRKIKALRAAYGKPLYAYANESCYSAAYWLACACDGIWLPTTGGVGSVGVIAEVYDLTAMDAKNGVRVELVTTGKQKADGHPDRPITDEIIARVQDRVNKIGAVFFASVAEARRTKPEDVEALQAACLLGADAKAANLADDVLSWDAFLADVQATFDTGKNRAKTTGAVMTPNEKTLSANVAAAQSALSAAKTDEERATCEAALLAALDAKVKYSKRTRTDEVEEDDGEDDDEPKDDDAPESEKGSAKEDEEDAETEGSEDASGDESEEDAKANSAKSLASLAHATNGPARVAALFAAVAKLTKRTKLAEQLGALDALVGRLENAKTLESRVAKLETKNRTDRVNALIERAHIDGKIAKGSAQATALHAQGLKDPEWLKGYLASLPKSVRTVEAGPVVPREAPAGGASLSLETMSKAEREQYESAARAANVTIEKFMEAARETASKMAASRPTH